MLTGDLPEAFVAVWPDIRTLFEEVADTLQREAAVETARFVGARGPSPSMHYRAHLSILRDISLQINADLDVTIQCTHPKILAGSGLDEPPGEPLPFVVGLIVWIAGHEFITLDPATLPPLRHVAEHEAALRAYVVHSRHLLESAMPKLKEAYRAALGVPPQG